MTTLRRVLVYPMHEHEHTTALQTLTDVVEAAGVLIGSADQSALDQLSKQGLIIRELSAATSCFGAEDPTPHSPLSSAPALDSYVVIKPHGLEITVVGPTQANLDELERKWQEWLDQQEQRIGAGDLQRAAIVESRPDAADPITLVLTNRSDTVAKLEQDLPPDENGYVLRIRGDNDDFIDVDL